MNAPLTYSERAALVAYADDLTDARHDHRMRRWIGRWPDGWAAATSDYDNLRHALVAATYRVAARLDAAT